MPTGTPKYFSFPFAVNGDLLSVPDPTQVGGFVSYQQGFGPDYQLINTDPSSLTIPRNQFNQLLFDITSSLQQLYQNGFPVFITSAMNDGAAFVYSQNAYVYQPADGNVYYSLVNSNSDVPPSSKWHILGGPTGTSYFNAATDTGSANHYNIAPVPSVGTPVAGDIIILQPTNSNSAGACDIIVNGSAATSIKTLQNQDPVANTIIPTGTYFLAYNAVTGFWVLLNPALGTAAYLNTGTSNGQVPVLNNTAAASGKIVLGSITIQWGSQAVSSGVFGGNTLTFGTAFSATPYHVNAMLSMTSAAATYTTGTGGTPNVSSVTSTGFKYQPPTSTNGATPVCNWFAIGPT